MGKHGAYRGTDIVPADTRGNVYDRAARKRWLLQAFGNGRTAPCRWCGRKLTASTVEVDRYPLCGHAGGGYRRKNIVPACKDCNGGRCTRRGAPCRTEPGRTLELFAWGKKGAELGVGEPVLLSVSAGDG